MQAFTAKGLSEEWVITHNGNILDKIISKTGNLRVIRKHITTTYLQAGMALPAFHAEKKKALAKGMEIINFDSTTPQITPVRNGMSAVVRPKMVKLFGRYVPLES